MSGGAWDPVPAPRVLLFMASPWGHMPEGSGTTGDTAHQNCPYKWGKQGQSGDSCKGTLGVLGEQSTTESEKLWGLAQSKHHCLSVCVCGGGCYCRNYWGSRGEKKVLETGPGTSCH